VLKLLGNYKNGNHKTLIFEDGTKIRETFDENATEFISDFPENFDFKITDCCDGACPYCHEGSTINGNHCELKNLDFLKTLKPFTEIAIGGGNIFSHPDLVWFLERLKSQKIIANITVNQKHIHKNIDLLKRFVSEKLVYGIGVSLTDSSDLEFFKDIDTLGNNVVIHTINGILSEKDVEVLKNRKVLILGYKFGLRRAVNYFEKESAVLKQNMSWLEKNLFSFSQSVKLLSFDNLAIEQLNPRKNLNISDKNWNLQFQGKDGSQTMYVDGPNKKFALTSTAPFEKRYDILDSIEEMFSFVQKDI